MNLNFFNGMNALF